MTDDERTQAALDLYGHIQKAVLNSQLDPLLVVRVLASTIAAIALSVNSQNPRPLDPHLLAASIGDDLAKTIIETSEGGGVQLQ